MKKSVIALVLAVVLVLTGCAAEETAKVFTAEELSVTLTTAFKEKQYEGFTASFESSKVLMLALKESRSLFPEPPATLEDYVSAVATANGLEGITPQEKDGLTWFTYQREVEKTPFTYYVFVYANEDAFWLVQFACQEKDAIALESQIFAYAGSVRV